MSNSHKPILCRGLVSIATQKLNAGQTGYDSTRIEWSGHHEIVITPSQDKTALASGNDPAWAEVRGALLCDIDLKIYALPIDKMAELLNVDYSDDDGVVFTGDTTSRFVGMDVVTDAQTGDTKSQRKVILYKVSFDLPEISLKTVAEGETAVCDVTLKGKAYPVFYTKADGSQGNMTYTIIDSVAHAKKWEASKSTIVFPRTATEVKDS